MQKVITILAATALFTSCMKPSEETVNEEKQEIGTTLDDWHKAAPAEKADGGRQLLGIEAIVQQHR